MEFSLKAITKIMERYLENNPREAKKTGKKAGDDFSGCLLLLIGKSS